MTLSTAVVETQFAESFREKLQSEPDAMLRKLREDAFAVFTQMGFPSMKTEDWKYTNVAPFTGLEWKVGEGQSNAPADLEWELLEVFDGGRNGFTALNVAFGEYAMYGNAAFVYTRAPGARSNLGGISIALTRPDDKPLRSFVEAAIGSNPDPMKTQWPAIARTGVIYTIVEGFDVDAGVQARLNKSAARVAWLVGATLRW